MKFLEKKKKKFDGYDFHYWFDCLDYWKNKVGVNEGMKINSI